MEWVYLLIIIFSGLTIYFICKENKQHKMVVPIILEGIVIVMSLVLFFITK